jgi:autotransporter-associated beta strand protein
LVKLGSKKLTLSGINTYTGDTLVNAGTLAVNGTLAAGGGEVFVRAGATLTGTGTIDRGVTIASGAILAPGNTIGELTVGALTLSNNFLLAWDLGTTSTDRVSATSVNFAGTSWTLQLGSGELARSNDVFVLLSWDTENNAAGLVSGVNFVGGGRWVVDNAFLYIQDNQLFLSGVWTIPEPGVALLWLTGAAIVWTARRRRTPA